MTDDPESRKLDGLTTRIHDAGSIRPPESKTAALEGTAWSMGRAGFDFVATVAASGFLGWCVDYFAETAPWGILVGIIAGFGFGMRNVWRVLGAKNMGN